MQDIAAMKTRSILLTLVLLMAAGVLLQTAHAQWPYRRVQYRYNNPRPAPPTNQVGKPTKPAEKPVKFKDLPLNSEFYFLADKDRKLFPRIKISTTSARSVPTPGNPNVTTSPVPADTQVIAKKANTGGKDEKKDQDDKKKKS